MDSSKILHNKCVFKTEFIFILNWKSTCLGMNHCLNYRMYKWIGLCILLIKKTDTILMLILISEISNTLFDPKHLNTWVQNKSIYLGSRRLLKRLGYSRFHRSIVLWKYNQYQIGTDTSLIHYVQNGHLIYCRHMFCQGLSKLIYKSTWFYLESIGIGIDSFKI